ncbi:MAG: NAD(P)-dependent glycerol-3-phosphate dehydrogenase [Desulfohalobiaceae bacterium]|nr:NAD(P)-dependent glycerol-3-phosphate dehydrogenase [Desulfohalobiaceae bacterium]
MNEKIAVLGAGAWGTTLANLMAEKKYRVVLWGRNPERMQHMRATRENERLLPGVELSSRLELSSELRSTVEEASCIIAAVPCQYLRSVLERVEPFVPSRPSVVCASKGIELTSLKPMSAVVAEALGDKDPLYAVLSGPSFAEEVSQGHPTAVSLGCENPSLAEELQQVLSTERFRVYTNEDRVGVELGGAIKNVMALATGIADGLGFGQNARAGLITRGLAEMARLGVALGGRRDTFMGLSGIGDLVLTCTGSLSRNRRVGLRLGGGESLEEIMSGMQSVAEGIKTAEALHRLGARLGVELPVTEQVHAILYQEKDPRLAVRELMSRELKPE